MKTGNHPYLILVALIALTGSCSDSRNGDLKKDIKQSIVKYFNGDPAYIHSDQIDYKYPNIVKVLASTRPDIGIATFDIYWIGEFSDDDNVVTVHLNDFTIKKNVDIYDKGTIDDPLVRKFTGHGMFNISIQEFEKLSNSDEVRFQFETVEGDPLGEVFISKINHSSRNRVYSFERKL